TSSLNIAPISIACCVVLLADPTRTGARAGVPSAIRMYSIACLRATSSAAVPKPLRTSTLLSAVGAAAIESGDVVTPRVNSPPEIAVMVGKPEEWTGVRSATRPPQPDDDTQSAIADCHCAIWSECENSW